MPYRLAALALHVLNIALLYHVVARLFRRSSTALAAAFVFTVVTSYDETQFWIAALFHPLNAALCLLTLLAFLVHLDSGSRSALACGLLTYAAALLTKAPAFPFIVVLAAACALRPGRPPRWRALTPFVGLCLAAAALNLGLGLRHSYLLERGYYRLGTHVVSNAAHYLGWILLPWEAVAEKVGGQAVYRAVRTGLQILLPIAAVALLVVGNARQRFFLIFGLAALAPFLPFVFAPVSRYTYLPAIALAPVVADRLPKMGRWTAGTAAAALALLSLADTMVRDNRYEYRERQMRSWVEDVERALPTLPDPPVVRIAGLPTLGIDPGIHVEAALRLAYKEPELRLEIPTTEDAPRPAGALVFESGRIRPPY